VSAGPAGPRTLKAVAAGAVGCALALASSAAAHDRTGTARGYVSTVASIQPNVLGLGAFVVGGDDRLLLRNLSGKQILILGYDGEPYLRFTPRGVYENVRSPATYLNRVRFPNGPVPGHADPTAEPKWKLVAAGVSYGWHDHRIQWMHRTPPRAVAAAPRRPHKIFDWKVPGTAGGKRFAVAGFLGYTPPPVQPAEPPQNDGDPAWAVPAAAGLGALAVLALMYRGFRRRKPT
jgi:hypothetical protein